MSTKSEPHENPRSVAQVVPSVLEALARIHQAVDNPTAEEPPETTAFADQAAHDRAIATLWRRAKAPMRHVGTGVDLNADTDWVRAFRSVMRSLESGGIIALTGVRGNGKTQLAVEAIRAFIALLRPCRFTTAVDFFLELRSSYRREATLSEREILQAFTDPALIVLDEIGKRSESEWENNMLFELVNRRYNNRSATILIDNRTREDFGRTIGPSLSDRINETGGVIEANWPSFRK